MKILAVDTSEQSCSVALVEDQVPICESFHLNRLTHSRTLMDMVAHMVEKRAGITIHDLDGFGVTCGPGSFTGLRIGISVVKGLACATSKPSAGISSLDAIACQFSFSSVPLCVMMDAKRGEVYCAVYNFRNGIMVQKSKEMVTSPEQAVAIAAAHIPFDTLEPELESGREAISVAGRLPDVAQESVSAVVDTSRLLFAGSGAVAFRPLIRKSMGDLALFAQPFQNFVRASSIAHMLFEDITLLSLSPDAITPVYLRKSDAEINYGRQQQCFC